MCKKLRALKNGYCIECEKLNKLGNIFDNLSDNPFNDLFGGSK